MEVREGCGPLELSRGRRGRIPLRATLSQIPLKSCGFPGAESARKRFFLRGGPAPLRKNQHDPAAQVAGIDWKSRGFTPSRALRGCSDGEIGSRRCRLLLCGSCFRRRGRGALCSPTPPRVTGCERAATLSRSPGDCFGGNFGFRRCGKRLRWRYWFSAARRAGSAGIWVSDDAGNGFGGDAGYWRREGLVRREFGFPTIRETASVEILVFDDAKGCSDENLVSGGAGVGRSAPLHPLG